MYTDFEKKTIRATGEVQAQLGCPVSFHPGRNPKAPFEIIRLYLEAGGAADKAIMSHLDRKSHFTENPIKLFVTTSVCMQSKKKKL